MAETTLTIGHGSTLAIGSGTGTITYTPIAGTTSIAFGSSKVDTVDDTEMATAGIDRVYQSGLRNPGDITAKINVRPGNTSQASLNAAFGNGVQPFQVTLPPVSGTVPVGGTATFQGIITSLDMDIPDDKKPTYSCKIQVSGPITWA